MANVSNTPLLSPLQPQPDADSIGRRVWPERPYFGLEFYREQDATLFHERDVEVRECANLLIRFGVKFLLLHGPSGCGKSSFLRAGLLPRLKHTPRFLPHFLNHGEDVIRCTADPLRELGRALCVALREPHVVTDRAFSGRFEQNADLIPETIKLGIEDDLRVALTKDHDTLGSSLLSALGALC